MSNIYLKTLLHLALSTNMHLGTTLRGGAPPNRVCWATLLTTLHTWLYFASAEGVLSAPLRRRQTVVAGPNHIHGPKTNFRLEQRGLLVLGKGLDQGHTDAVRGVLPGIQGSNDQIGGVVFCHKGTLAMMASMSSSVMVPPPPLNTISAP